MNVFLLSTGSETAWKLLHTPGPLLNVIGKNSKVTLAQSAGTIEQIIGHFPA